MGGVVMPLASTVNTL